MKKNFGRLSTILSIYIIGQVASFAQHRPLAQAPQPVKDAVHAQMGMVSLVEKRIQGGVIVFDVSGQKNGRELELTLTANGEVISSGNEVKLNELSVPLQTAIRKHAANARLGAIIREVEEGVTTYRLDLMRANLPVTVDLGENGELLDEEVAVPMSSLPAAVQKTIKGEVGNGQIRSLGKVTENGQASFSVSAIKDGNPLDFSVALNGDLEELDMSAVDLPDAAQKTVQQQIGDGRIVRTTKNSEDGDVYFAVEIAAGGKVRTLNLSDDGSLISEEQVVTLEQTPSAVHEVIASKTAGAKVESIVKITEDGAVSFDVEVVRSGKVENLNLNSAGKTIEQK